MRRWARTSTVLLLAAGSALSLPVSASAAPSSCQGTPATIVGTPGESLAGTSGPDVVVTNGATDTSTGDGDDLVCVTSGPGVPSVDGYFVSVGAGDDVVDGRDVGSTLVGADLGTGADSFFGGPGSDVVNAGLWFEEDAEDPDDDVVVTGAGADHVTTGGRPRQADADQVDLGEGPDVLTVFGDTSGGGHVSGGTGADTIEVERATRSGEWRFDQRHGFAQVTRSGVFVTPIATWDGIERFRLTRLPSGSSVVFLGGDGDERLRVLGAPTRASMGGGNDLVDVEVGPRMVEQGLRIRGGPGRDRLRIEKAESVSLDLGSGLLELDDGGPSASQAADIEDVDVVTHTLRLVGTPGPNRLRYAACSGSVSVRGGDDQVEFRGTGDWGCVEPAVLPVRGGAGDDTLVGGRHDDHLVGGSGWDTADGMSGHDVCRAERTRRCEA